MRIIFIVITLFLCGCAGSGNLSDSKSDADGHQFFAKPGMSRLYIVHGNFKTEYSSQKMLLPAPMAIGAAIGSAARSSLDPVGPEGTPNFVLGIYFLNGKNIGNIGKNQFMALDIDPGKYTVSFIHNALGPVNSDNLELEVAPGSVLFVISEVVFDDSGAHAFIVPCTDKCVERVTVSHRVSASWPTNK